MSDLRDELLRRVSGVDPLRWVASALTMGLVGLFSVFVVGYAVTDPGGWAGIGGSVGWVLLMLGLCALALFRPGSALVVSMVAACGPLGFGLWSLTDYEAASAWENAHGPISGILVVTVCAPAAVAGLFHPRAAGFLILAVSVAPLLLAAVGAGSHFYEPLSIGLLFAPVVASGLLFLVAGRRTKSPPALGPASRAPLSR